MAMYLSNAGIIVPRCWMHSLDLCNRKEKTLKDIADKH